MFKGEADCFFGTCRRRFGLARSLESNDKPPRPKKTGPQGSVILLPKNNLMRPLFLGFLNPLHIISRLGVYFDDVTAVHKEWHLNYGSGF